MLPMDSFQPFFLIDGFMLSTCLIGDVFLSLCVQTSTLPIPIAEAKRHSMKINVILAIAQHLGIALVAKYNAMK